MKTLLFDLLHAQPLGGAKFHGGGEYIKSVFQALTQVENAAYALEVCLNPNEFIDEWILSLIHEKHIPIHETATVADILEVIKGKEDKKNLRFFTGMIYAYDTVTFPDGVKTYGVCHGLRGMEKPYDQEAVRYISGIGDLKECIRNTVLSKRTQRKLLKYFSGLLEKFDVVVTVSMHSKTSITLNLPEVAQKRDIRVFSTPSKHYDAPDNVETDQPYIMLVSANRWIKNSYRGIKAIENLYQKGHLKGVKTYVYGSYPERLRKKIRFRNHFMFFDYVSADELERAYQGCKVFFYPTLNEGFGLPPLEAMKYGRTCVISAVCSLPEIYGDSVYYCNPYDIMEMGNRILQAICRPIDKQRVYQQAKAITSMQDRDLNELVKLLLNN